MSERFVCIHGHFYQPPRENPWLEAVEVQDSAYPYHDWNERVTAECYAPNADSRVLDGESRIIDISNNFSKISFNFGPTLLAWLEEKARSVYNCILEADRISGEHYAGHGSALAQAYNHMIMPLANARDRETQVIWGIRDFEHRFGRSPEGMWLPEAAVNTDCLEMLAAHGIKFTILSPHSARAERQIGSGDWRDTNNAHIDPTMPYAAVLPSGKQLTLFFYDGPVSQAIAFERLLDSGEKFAQRIGEIFSDSRDWPQLAHIATDGETYGHHHPHGDMALAYALRYIEEHKLATLTNYAEFLEKHPPTHEAQIFENSSWSCVHGVERWRSNCGCNSGGHPGWNQEWRAPLREAMDWLRDALAPLYEQEGRKLLKDPWAARNDYVSVVLDRSPENRGKFFTSHAVHKLSNEETVRALNWLELQRHAQLMYTSCGWFFDELSGLETVQAIQYAGRALQLASDLTGNSSLEPQFLERLAKAKSNIPDHQDGKKVFEMFVRPGMLDLKRVGAHYAVSSLFSQDGTEQRVYCYSIIRRDFKTLSSGKTKLVVGHAKISSEITTETAEISFGVVHMGDHNITGGVREFRGEEQYKAGAAAIITAFERGDFAELVRVVDKSYGSDTYTLKFLFRDEQRKIVKEILKTAFDEADHVYRELYQNRASLMRFMAALGMPQIRRFQMAAEFTINSDLLHEIEQNQMNADQIRSLLEEAKKAAVPLDAATLEFAFRKRLDAAADAFHHAPQEIGRLEALNGLVDASKLFTFPVSYWAAQNFYFDVMKHFYPQVLEGKNGRPSDPQKWIALFRSLGEKLSFHAPS